MLSSTRHLFAQALAGAAFASVFACSSKDDPPLPPATHQPTATTVASSASTVSSGVGGEAGADGMGGAGGAGGAGGRATGGSGGMGTAGGGGAAPGTCDDGAMNGAETDVDCGGGCAPCELDKTCAAPSDCASKSCGAGKKCVPPTCTDAVANGAETDVDCGGPSCSACAPQKACIQPTDCTSGVCTGSICQTPSCVDGVKNGGEDDVDCGSACPEKCALGKKCDSDADCATAICNTSKKYCDCPKDMRTAPAPGGGSYCIDVTEVAYWQYDAFLAANPQSINNACTWNLTYVPLANYPPSGKRTAAHPVTDIDWCDAYEYCRYAGRHLCGDVAGGPLAFDAPSDHNKSEWFSACSAQNTKPYPYSGSYAPSTCNGVDKGLGDTVAVRDPGKLDAAPTSCEGGLSGIFHMSGNVREWEDACDGNAGQADSCRTRGGSFVSGAADLACAAAPPEERGATASDLGFRCCL